MAKMIQVPDGEGNYVDVEQGKFYHEEADLARQKEIIAAKKEEARWHRVGLGCDRFDTLQKAAGTEMNLSEEDMVCAMYLNILNWQYFYPPELGGPERFAELCKGVQAWFNENKDKP